LYYLCFISEGDIVTEKQEKSNLQVKQSTQQLPPSYTTVLIHCQYFMLVPNDILTV